MGINTEIWGASSDWGLHNEFFGVGRSPTSTDDENKYPQFYSGLNGNGILYSYAEDIRYSTYFENPTGHYDPTCAYIGIQGNDLPQYNINAYVYASGETNPRIYARLQKTGYTIPFTFAQCWFDKATFTAYAGNIAGYLTGFDGYRLNNASIKEQQKTFRYSPDAPAHPYSSSFNQVSAPMLNFGTKSVILIPYIQTSTDGEPYNMTTYSLKEFSELTQTQIDNLYIVRVYCRTYVRTGIGKYAYDINAKHYMYPQYIGDWEFEDFNVTGFSDNLALARGGSNGNCELVVFGAVLETNYFSRISTGNYDSPILSSHACIVLTNDKWEVKQITEGFYSGCIYGNLKKEGTNYVKDNIIDMVRKGVAAYGLFFLSDPTDIDLSNVADSDFWSDKMYVGIIDDDGLTRGRYSHGLNNILTNNYQWSDVRESTYDPLTPHPITPTNEYSNTTQSHSIGNLATLTKRYILNNTAVLSLGAELWKISGDIADVDPNDRFKNYAEMITDTFLTNSPIGAIVSLQRFPMSIPHSSETLENIKLGKVTSSVAGYPMEKAAYEYAFEKIPIYPKFVNSFLDYSPYTQFELYIPFCGTVTLDPAEILGRELWCKLIVDFCTGTCTGYVYSDELLLHTQTGKLAIDIPVTGTDTATVNSSISNASTAYRQQSISNLGGQLTSGMKLLTELQNTDNPFFETNIGRNIIGGMQSGAVNAIKKSQIQYDLTHIQIPLHIIGSASAVGLWACDLDCRLIIYYPTGNVIDSIDPAPEFNMSALNEFAMLNGLATCETGLISEYTGYIQCTDTQLDRITTNSNGYNATSTEIQLIHSALTAGIDNNT